MADKQQDGLSIKVTGSIPTGKVTANSTAPTTLVDAGYSVVKNGYTARLAVWAEWTNAGATNTTATFTLDDVLTALAAKGIVPVSQNGVVGGHSIANNAGSGSALLTLSSGAAVATFGSASLTKVEQIYHIEVQ